MRLHRPISNHYITPQ